MSIRIIYGKYRQEEPLRALKFGLQHYSCLLRFGPTCVYELDENQGQWNKLGGFGHLPHHHCDSARFGWRYVKRPRPMIELAAYVYRSGSRDIISLCKVDVDQIIDLSIRTTDNAYLFKVDALPGQKLLNTQLNPRIREPFVELFINRPKLWPAAYPLNAYFGGRKPAPHNMIIETF